MKSQPATTIWESASRPLFVRSVWLEAATPNERLQRRGPWQRHFILDYEPGQQTQQPQRGLFNAPSLSPTKRCGNKTIDAALGHSLSCDFDCWHGDLHASAENLLLVGSAKAQLHPSPAPAAHQQQLLQAKTPKMNGGRRSSLLSRSSHGNQDATPSNRRLPELIDLISRRSSYQDLQSTLSSSCANPDERLAERVLNWLDLAGKMDVMKTGDEVKAAQTTSTAQRRESLSRRATSTAAPLQAACNTSRSVPPTMAAPPRRVHTHRKRSMQAKCAAAAAATAYSCHQHHRRPDSMKHITIIFNKEGIPVRLNRPARNIDLCSLAASAGTTRRLAGALASARLYKSAAEAGADGDCGGSNGKSRGGNTAVAVSTARRQQTPRGAANDRQGDDVATKSSYNLQKRLHDEFTSATTTNVGGLHDSKKQLHIFMPSLPKKGMLTASLMGNSYAGGGDDGASALSGSFSELCKL